MTNTPGDLAFSCLMYLRSILALNVDLKNKKSSPPVYRQGKCQFFSLKSGKFCNYPIFLVNLRISLAADHPASIVDYMMHQHLVYQ